LIVGAIMVAFIGFVAIKGRLGVYRGIVVGGGSGGGSGGGQGGQPGGGASSVPFAGSGGIGTPLPGIGGYTGQGGQGGGQGGGGATTSDGTTRNFLPAVP
jgi:hypothetical protein